MKYIINSKQEDELKNIIQNLIDSTLSKIKEESEDWGLGEMDEYNEVNSIEYIKIDRIVTYTRITVYVDVYLKKQREWLDNVMSEINYRMEQWIPNIFITINEVHRSDTFI